jgi:hypothetical protein
MARKQKKSHSRWRTPAMVGAAVAVVGSGAYALRRRRTPSA